MHSSLAQMRSLRNLMVGVLMGLSCATPAFAAAGEIPHQSMTYLLLGSIVLLVVGLVLETIASAEPPRNLGPRVLDPNAKR